MARVVIRSSRGRGGWCSAGRTWCGSRCARPGQAWSSVVERGTCVIGCERERPGRSGVGLRSCRSSIPARGRVGSAKRPGRVSVSGRVRTEDGSPWRRCSGRVGLGRGSDGTRDGPPRRRCSGRVGLGRVRTEQGTGRLGEGARVGFGRVRTEQRMCRPGEAARAQIGSGPNEDGSARRSFRGRVRSRVRTENGSPDEAAWAGSVSGRGESSSGYEAEQRAGPGRVGRRQNGSVAGEHGWAVGARGPDTGSVLLDVMGSVPVSEPNRARSDTRDEPSTAAPAICTGYMYGTTEPSAVGK